MVLEALARLCAFNLVFGALILGSGCEEDETDSQGKDSGSNASAGTNDDGGNGGNGGDGGASADAGSGGPTDASAGTMGDAGASDAGAGNGGDKPCTDKDESGCDFVVTVAAKTADHPWNGMGFAAGYLINGKQGAALDLKRGKAYEFLLKQSCNHPLYLSKLATGINVETVTDGVKVSAAEACNGAVMTYTPPKGSPNLLYYQCTKHDQMGGPINLTD